MGQALLACFCSLSLPDCHLDCLAKSTPKWDLSKVRKAGDRPTQENGECC